MEVLKNRKQDSKSLPMPQPNQSVTDAESQRLIDKFLRSIEAGHKKDVKRCIKTGVDVNCVDQSGRSALFIACFGGHTNVAELLLKHGALVNQRTPGGCTPVHAACGGSDLRLVQRLIEHGGDVRLHDDNGRLVASWAAGRMDRHREKILNYLHEMHDDASSLLGRQPAINSSPIALTGRRAGPASVNSKLASSDSRRKRSSTNKSACCPTDDYETVKLCGYGPMYVSRYGGTVETVGCFPVIDEFQLRHDEDGCTYNNGVYMVMESMFWHKVKVTVKRLHRSNLPRGAHPDLLIHESKLSARLRHPNLLLLMAICYGDGLHSMALLYERINSGSVHWYMYVLNKRLSDDEVCRIFQQICSALIYVHQRGFLHTSISSHAIQLTTTSFAKLSNFEYAVHCGSSLNQTPSAFGAKSIEKSKQTLEDQLSLYYRWTAPEVLAGKPFAVLSDIYSLCAVLWETVSGIPPWHGEEYGSVAALRHHFAVVGQGLSVSAVNHPFVNLLRPGLAVDVLARQLTLDQFRSTLDLALARNRFKQDVQTPESAAVLTARKRINDSPRQAGGSASNAGYSRSQHRQRHQQQQQQVKVPFDESTDDMLVGSPTHSRHRTGMRARHTKETGAAVARSRDDMSPRVPVGEIGAVQPGYGDQNVVELPAVDLGRDHADKAKNPPLQRRSSVGKAEDAKLRQRREYGDSLESSSETACNVKIFSTSSIVPAVSAETKQELGDARAQKEAKASVFNMEKMKLGINSSDVEVGYASEKQDLARLDVDDNHGSKGLDCWKSGCNINATRVLKGGSAGKTVNVFEKHDELQDTENDIGHVADGVDLVAAVPDQLSQAGACPVEPFCPSQTRSFQSELSGYQNLASEADVADVAQSADTNDSCDQDKENPFRQDLLTKDTLQMYHEMLKRPLPRLPKLYTLPSRRLAEEGMGTGSRRCSIGSRNSTMLETLLSRCSPVTTPRGQSSTSKTTAIDPTPAVLQNFSPLPEAASASASDERRLKRSYLPTFGISLNELKAAIAPRVSAIYQYEPSVSATDSDRQEPKSSSESASVGVQPASHHRPSFYDPTSFRPPSPKFTGTYRGGVSAKHVGAEIVPIAAGLLPGITSLKQGFTASMSTGNVNSQSESQFGGSKQPTDSSAAAKMPKTQFATAALKSVATVPAAGKDKEYVPRFRSDPVLLYSEDNDAELESVRPVPPPSPVTTYRTDAKQDICSDSTIPAAVNVQERLMHFKGNTGLDQTITAMETPEDGQPMQTGHNRVDGFDRAAAAAFQRCSHREVADGPGPLANATTTGPTMVEITSHGDISLNNTAPELPRYRNVETQTSRSIIFATHNRSDTDEESTHMVSSALNQAKVEVAQKYPVKKIHEISCSDISCSNYNAAAVRRYLLSPTADSSRDTLSVIAKSSNNNYNNHNSSSDYRTPSPLAAREGTPTCTCSNNIMLSDKLLAFNAMKQDALSARRNSLKTDIVGCGNICPGDNATLVSLSSDSSNSTSESSMASDSYFDDALAGHPLRCQARHLRFESTIGFDNQSASSLPCTSFRSPFVADGAKGRRNVEFNPNKGGYKLDCCPYAGMRQLKMSAAELNTGERQTLSCSQQEDDCASSPKGSTRKNSNASTGCRGETQLTTEVPARSNVSDCQQYNSTSNHGPMHGNNESCENIRRQSSSTIVIETDTTGYQKISIHKAGLQGNSPLASYRTTVAFPEMTTEVVLDPDQTTV